ncbi:MAG TPA: dolichyl-phosphate beta-glucosyltransferase [Anaerolineaceae bacterium]|nr:dolichyl-phosphate beta-glucosyltransferase [Anaerolineaceae bacterium]
MSNPKLSIVIPAHNEAARLPKTLQEVHEYIISLPFEAEVLVVENASSDATAAIVREVMPAMPELRLLELAEPGKGNAIHRGMLEAKGAWRFMADADLSMPISQVSRFIPPQLEDADLAIASREAKGARRIDEPAFRHFVGRVFNLLVRALVLPGIQDSQCGFKCFSATATELIFPLQTEKGWSFDVELLAIAREKGLKIVEIPIDWTYYAGSRMNVFKEAFRMANDLLRIRRKRKAGAYRA